MAADKPDGRKENALATQAALRQAGRRLFGQHGYEATSLTALCAEAGVTTGALYHHFGDKKGLFAAVAEELDRALVALLAGIRAQALARGAGEWEAFLCVVDAMLIAGTDPGGRRIALADAGAVLGAPAWNAIRERHGLGAMIATVERLQQQQLIVAADARRLARLMLGVLYGAIEALPDDPAAMAEAMQETRTLAHAMLASVCQRPSAGG